MKKGLNRPSRFLANYHKLALLRIMRNIKKLFGCHFQTEFFFQIMFSYFEPNFTGKFLWENVFFFFFFFFFQILAKIELTVNKNRLFGRHFETVQHFMFFIYFFFQIMFFYSVYIMVQISLQNSGGKLVFLGGFHNTPLGHQRE